MILTSLSSLQFSTFTQNGDSYTIHGTRQATVKPPIKYEWGTQVSCSTTSQYFTPEWAGTNYGFTVQPGAGHENGPCWNTPFDSNLDWLVVNYANQEFTFPWQFDEGINPQGGPPRCRILPSTLPGLAVNHGQGGIYCWCLLDPPS